MPESEENYRRLFEHMSEGFAYCRMIFDNGQPVDFIYLDVNPAFEALTGLRNVVGKSVTEVIPGIRESDPRLFEVYGRVASGGKPEKLEMFVEALQTWFSISVYSPSDECFVSVFDVITQHKYALDALRTIERRYRLISENSADVIWTLDLASMRFTYVSPSVMRLRGYTAEEVMAGSLEATMTPESFQTVMDELPGRLVAFSAGDESAHVWTTELLQPRKDGSIVATESVTRVVGDAQGHAMEVVGVTRDITERKRAEEQREKLQLQLLQAQKMESVGRLAGGVAHDFNNLLTVINGHCDLMLRRLDARDPVHASVAEIRKAGGRAAELTRQLLAFSRKQIIEPRALDLNQLISESRDMFGRLIGEDIELAIDLAPDLGHVLAGEGQLQQVLMNLVVNARDAMPEGGRLTIRTARRTGIPACVSTAPDAKPEEYVLLVVSDTGVGMDEETRKRACEPFFTTKGEGAGTGLGLATVYGIVEQCGGWIDIASEPENGATFTIGLPRTAAPALPGERPPSSGSLRGSETVLVVEDQDDVRKLAVMVLQQYGYRVLEAANGEEALLLSARHAGPLHLLLTDVVMPGMTGKELADRLRPLRPGLPVLYMSGHPGNVIARRGVLDSGVNYIPKPFDPDDLARKVREVLGSSRPASRVLVVDDDDGVRDLFQGVLEGAGYEVLSAGNGEQAMAIVQSHALDVVVTDLVMPVREGIETIRAIRKGYPALKIIAVSGAFSGSFLEAAQILGASAALMKPVTPEQLLAAVRA